MEPKIQVLVDIESPEARVREGTSQRTGKPYRFAIQEAWVFAGGKHPEKHEIMLNDPRDAYGAGRYFATKLKATRRGLELNLSELTPVPVAASSRAAS